MMETEEKAVWLKHNSGNCCQSVTEALMGDNFPEGITPEALNRLASGFRTGMGGMEATCGALCGAVMAAGLKTGGIEAGKLARQMHERFTELSGASICKVLKSRGADGKIVCECDDCVRHAVRAYKEIMK